MFPIPVSVWVLVIVSVIGLPGVTFAVLGIGGRVIGLDRRRVIRVSVTAALGWMLWAAISSVLAYAGVYRLTPTAPNPLIGVAGLGAAIAALLCTRIPVVSRILAGPAILSKLTLPHILRIVGGGAFMVALAFGTLPAIFAVPAGLGDIAIGIEAIFLARSLRHGTGGRRAAWFNILDLLDFAIAFTVAILAGPGAARVLAVTPSTEAVALLPLVIIPTVVVPLAVTLHVVSLMKLRAAARASRSPASSPATDDSQALRHLL